MTPPSLAYTHVVFDFDGTLVDSLRTKVSNAGELFAERYGADRDLVARRYYFHSGIARRLLFERIAEDVLARGLTETEYQDLDQVFTRLNLERAGAAPPWPAVPAVLAQLAASGVTMAVSSSAPEHDLAPRVRASGLGDFFGPVLASRDGFRKGPDHVASLEKLWKVERGHFLSVGDELADARLAAAARVDCALVSHTITPAEAATGPSEARPRFILTTFDELLTIVGSQNP